MEKKEKKDEALYMQSILENEVNNKFKNPFGAIHKEDRIVIPASRRHGFYYMLSNDRIDCKYDSLDRELTVSAYMDIFDRSGPLSMEYVQTMTFVIRPVTGDLIKKDLFGSK